MLQPVDAELLALGRQRRLVLARQREVRREIGAFCQLLRELEAGARTGGVRVHGVVEQPKTVLVAHLLILATDVGDLAHLQRQPQCIERRPPQLAFGQRLAEHRERVGLLARIAGALVGDVGGSRGALQQERLLARALRRYLEDDLCQPQPVACVLRRGRRDLAEHRQAGAIVVAPEGSIGVGAQARAGLGDRPRLALDLRLQLDRGIGEVVPLEGFVGGLRDAKAERQRGAECDGANKTDHGWTPGNRGRTPLVA
ncbi:hypothetical protein ACVWWI_004157 [Bradyrhizobium sp. USDA 3686]